MITMRCVEVSLITNSDTVRRESDNSDTVMRLVMLITMRWEEMMITLTLLGCYDAGDYEGVRR